MSKNKDKEKKLGPPPNNVNEEFGEFVCTEFGWITPEKQKEVADKLDKITKKKK